MQKIDVSKFEFTELENGEKYYPIKIKFGVMTEYMQEKLNAKPGDNGERIEFGLEILMEIDDDTAKVIDAMMEQLVLLYDAALDTVDDDDPKIQKYLNFATVFDNYCTTRCIQVLLNCKFYRGLTEVGMYRLTENFKIEKI